MAFREYLERLEFRTAIVSDRIETEIRQFQDTRNERTTCIYIFYSDGNSEEDIEFGEQN